MAEKMKHAAENAVGKAKTAAGKVTGNEEMEAKGRRDQAKAEMKKTGDTLSDAAKRASGK